MWARGQTSSGRTWGNSGAGPQLQAAVAVEAPFAVAAGVVVVDDTLGWDIAAVVCSLVGS